MRRSYLAPVLGLAAVALVLAGCGSSDNNPPRTRVRFINSATGLSNEPLTVTVNGQTVNAWGNPVFGSETSGAEVDAGTAVPVTVVQGGTTLASGTLNLTPNVDQPILFTGVSGGTGTSALKLVALSPQDLTGTPSNNQPRVYFVNAAPDLTATSLTYSIAGGPQLSSAGFTNIDYGLSSAAVLPDLGAHSQSVTFQVDANGQVVNSAPMNLTGGTTYLVVLTGRTTASGATPALALNVVPLT